MKPCCFNNMTKFQTPAMPATAQRESNFELLRIVAILLILAHHLLIATKKVEYYDTILMGGETANAFLVCGVNCFILISGYFGIKLRLSKFLKIIFLIIAVIIADTALAHFPPTSQYINIEYGVGHITPILSGANWFIPSYLGLMLISPVLNKALSGASQKEHKAWAWTLTAMCVGAYLLDLKSVNATGYNLVHFIYIYIIGAYLRRYPPRISQAAALGLYLAGSIAAALAAQFIGTGFTAFAYNSPQILLSSVGLFLFFSKIHFSSRAINIAASAVFCVFLFHYAIIYVAVQTSTLPTAAAVFLASLTGGTAIGLMANQIWKLILRIPAFKS